MVAAPNPVAPFSHAAEAGCWAFVTGRMPHEPGDPTTTLPEGIEVWARNVMTNPKRALAGIGLGFKHVVGTHIFLTHFCEDDERMKRGPRVLLQGGTLPARTCVGVTGLAYHARGD